MDRPPVQRRCGVLLHPSSLPGAGYCGNLGSEAHSFVDLIADSGLSIWQMLPLGPTHDDLCPYQSSSAHAGNPDLIDLTWLADRGWLSAADVGEGQVDRAARRGVLARASRPFFEELAGRPESALAQAYTSFVAEAGYWLEDYARFEAFRESLGGLPWTEWPAALRKHEDAACDALAAELSDAIAGQRFCQFVFYQQWTELAGHAHERGLALFGDMPIYVNLDSADVWAYQELFHLDQNGAPTVLTGVPPDYFSATGQLWGNPQYCWERLHETNFDWWLQRFATLRRQFDIVRIDHFRALEAYWNIPGGARTAMEGEWVAAPGRELLKAVREAFPDLALVAENLGSISAEVEALRAEFSLPGMLILQFAFDGSPANPYLPHNHCGEEVVYTGTHDNNTTVGWFDSLDDPLRQAIYDYFCDPREPMPWMLIRQAMASVANTAVIPWQDFLGLDGSHRMNTPGSTEGNWRWRFNWDQVPPHLSEQLRQLLYRYNRLPQ
ncbi:MAG: 4-alpha-glucanotransferase [Halioglobus sp.]|nr:4-alpha-glucanotransferase [Halioglobus sp.]